MFISITHGNYATRPMNKLEQRRSDREVIVMSHRICRSGLCRKACRGRRRRRLCASSRSCRWPNPSSADSSSAPSSPSSSADRVAISFDDRSLRRHDINLHGRGVRVRGGRVLTAPVARRRREGRARVAAGSASGPCNTARVSTG